MALTGASEPPPAASPGGAALHLTQRVQAGREKRKRERAFSDRIFARGRSSVPSHHGLHSASSGLFFVGLERLFLLDESHPGQFERLPTPPSGSPHQQSANRVKKTHMYTFVFTKHFHAFYILFLNLCLLVRYF